MSAYYNEIDEFAAQWIRNLIMRRLVAPGDVDTRSIEDVKPDDLKPYTQCHFFAGIAVWPYALRLAGWPDDREVWTGSCPCQPFSAAGKGVGFADERHLWPLWFHHIEQRRPAAIFGEQVASKDADPWIDLVQNDLEALGYPFGAVAFPSASVGAPHIRDRTFWMAYRDHKRRVGEHPLLHRIQPGRHAENCTETAGRGEAGGLAYANDTRLEGRQQPGCQSGDECTAWSGGLAGGLGDAHSIGAGWNGGSIRSALAGVHGQPCSHDAHAPSCTSGLAYTQRHVSAGQAESAHHLGAQGERSADRTGGRGAASLRLVDPSSGGEQLARPGPTNGYWSDADWLRCRDGKWRPVEPGTFPLAYGLASRVGRLRAYGNAINARQAQAFIEVAMECMP